MAKRNGETMVKPEFQAIKNHPKVAYTTLLIIDFILVFPWCPERDLNSHSHKPRDFKSLVSTDFTIRAWEKIGGAFRSRTGLDGFAIRYITALLTRQSLSLYSQQQKLCYLIFGAGNETRTRDPDLGKVVLYQLSYSRTLQVRR